MWNKNYIFLIMVCIVIVVVSGCTSSSSSKYDDNYISFSYPNYMTMGGGNNSGGESIEGHQLNENGKVNKLYFIFEIHPTTTTDYPTSLETWKTNWINDGSDIGLSAKESGYTTIDGIRTAYVISSDNGYDYYLIKGNMGYLLMFYGGNIPESEIKNLINSIHIK